MIWSWWDKETAILYTSCETNKDGMKKNILQMCQAGKKQVEKEKRTDGIISYQNAVETEDGHNCGPVGWRDESSPHGKGFYGCDF